MDHIYTVEELAGLLKISKSQVYELIKERTRTGEPRLNPLPALRIGTTVRFRSCAVEDWLQKLGKAA